MTGIPSDDALLAASTPSNDLADRVRGVLAVPVHRFLGVELLDPGRPAAGVKLIVGETALNNVGVLHGGVVTGLLDMAGYLAVLPMLAPGEKALTHEISASLIRGVDLGATLHISGSVLRRGRRMAFLRAEAQVDGVVVAAAQVTKSVLREG